MSSPALCSRIFSLAERGNAERDEALDGLLPAVYHVNMASDADGTPLLDCAATRGLAAITPPAGARRRGVGDAPADADAFDAAVFLAALCLPPALRIEEARLLRRIRDADVIFYFFIFFILLRVQY